MLIDSHCHLQSLDTSQEQTIEDVINQAKAHDIQHFLCVSITLDDAPIIHDITKKFDCVSMSIGLHPTEKPSYVPSVKELIDLATSTNAIAIGETGLDYFHIGEADRPWQQLRFRHHIQAARQAKKPLIIHMRDADEDTLRIMKEEGADEVGGVMHCFTSTWEVAKLAMDLNFYISFSGIVTFKNAKQLQDVALKMPGDRILIETDCPYLAPVPYRGKPNVPAYMQATAQFLANLRNESYETFGQQTTKNYLTLFNYET